MPTKQRYVPWECSLAFEQSCAEARTHVQRLLDKWGGPKYNDWPNRATVMQGEPIAMNNYKAVDILVRVAQRGIIHSIKAINIPGDTEHDAHEHVRVFFSEVSHGSRTVKRGPELVAYVEMLDASFDTYHLGCSHPRTIHNRVAPQLTRHECADCGCVYEVDTSD